MPSGKGKPHQKPAFNNGAGIDFNTNWRDYNTTNKEERKKLTLNRKKNKKR